MAASDSFAYSADDLERISETHAKMEFLASNVELFVVKMEDEREEPRIVYEFCREIDGKVRKDLSN